MNLKTSKILFLSAIAIFAVCLTSFAQDSIPLVDSALRDTASQIPPIAIPPTGELSGLMQKVLEFLAAFIAAALPLIQFILKRIPTAYSVKIKGWGGKLLDLLTFFQPDKSLNGVNHISKVLLIICFLGLAGMQAGYSQSIFDPVRANAPAKAASQSPLKARSIIITSAGDSIFSGFRIGGLSALVAVGTNSTSAIYAGFTAGYEHDTKKAATGRWATDYAIMGGIYGGAGKQAPTNWQTTGAIGLSVLLLNKHLVLGVLYDFTMKKPLAATGPNGYITPTN